MDIILYNPLSRNGKNIEVVDKLKKILAKEDRKVVVYNLLELKNDFVTFLNEQPLEARIIIVGGDGTLNKIANYIQNIEIKQDIYLYRGGTGNDFARSIKSKDKLISIKPYLFNLPYTIINDQKYYFLNGIGIGIDGKVVYEVNNSKGSKNKRNYFRKAIKSFLVYKPIETTVKFNNQTFNVKKTWMVTIMNSKFFGGGMRVAPKAKRTSEDLYVILVKGLPKIFVVLLFPLIYLGLHVFFKPFVKIYKTKEIEVLSKEDTYVQLDGEHIYPVNKLIVKK